MSAKISFSFVEYSKGAKKKKRRDATIEDVEKPDGQIMSEPEPEIEIGREVISRDGFFPTEVRTPARRDPTRDFKMRIKVSAERAEFFPVFIPGDARSPSLSILNQGHISLELEDGQEGILCVLERENGELQFTMFDLWGPVHITSFPAKNWQEIIQHFSESRRFAGPARNFFWKELREQRLEETKQKLVDEERKDMEEAEKKCAEEERKRLENQGRLAGLLSDLKSLIKKGGWI